MISRLFASVVFLAALVASAQEPASPGSSPVQPGGRGGLWGGMDETRGVLGTVTETSADHYTVKTESGDIYTVHFSANTRIIKAPERRRGQRDEDTAPAPPQSLKASEIKVGDAVAARGEVDASSKSVGAVLIALIDPERAKQMREMAANYGKTWLMGRVTAIDGVKVTLQGRPGEPAHTFVADENTTFRKRRDPITLGDIQVGDAVRVEGALKAGQFVAATVAVMVRPQNAQPQSQRCI